MMPLPSDSTESKAAYLKKLTVFIVIFAAILIMENTVGCPALRVGWEAFGSHDPADMYACHLIIITTGERRYVQGYQPMICFVDNAEFTLTGWLVGKAKGLYRRVTDG